MTNNNKKHNYKYEKTPSELARRAIKSKTRACFPLKGKFCVQCPAKATERHHYPIDEHNNIQFDIFDFFCHECHMKLHFGTPYENAKLLHDDLSLWAQAYSNDSIDNDDYADWHAQIMNDTKSLLTRTNKLLANWDEDQATQVYCESMSCSACEGTDCSGEPNGYGCDGMEEYCNKQYDELDQAIKLCKAILE